MDHRFKILWITTFAVLILSKIITLTSAATVTSAAATSYILDDFEYWDSPYNHGWETSDYLYPIYGPQIGYGHIQTIIDFQEGSRVLEVFYQPSIFNNLAPYYVAKFNLIDPDTGKPPLKRYFTIKVKTDFAIEYFAMLHLSLLVRSGHGQLICFNYLPIEVNSPRTSWVDGSPQIFEYSEVKEIYFPIGREIQDGGWHWIIRDLEADLKEASEFGLLDPDDDLGCIYGIILQGNHFRVDEIIFKDDIKETENKPPFIWYPGPQFATLFQPYELILYVEDKNNDPIIWTATVGGAGAHGMAAPVFIESLPPDPNSDWPDSGAPSTRARLSFIPQVFEDLIITIQAYDGFVSQAATFPLTVVNYPITNHPPILEKSGINCKFAIPVGERFQNRFKAYDQDNDPLIFKAFIDGLPNYQYGPWVENLIDPKTGWFDFTPKFEGNHVITIVVSDDKGLRSSAQWRITAYVEGGGWYNHPPVRLGKPTAVQVIRAGEAYLFPTCFDDPDGDQVYYSCNIGAITEDGIFSFFTYFPGQYNITITAYDTRGGMDNLTFFLDVQPWWAI